MADSEVRQKFEVPSETPDAFEQAWKEFNSGGVASGWEMVAFTSGFGKGFAAGMRAGEIAQREEIIKAVCTGCRLGWPEQGRPGHGIVIHIPPDPRGLYACQAVAIRALPLSGAGESKK